MKLITALLFFIASFHQVRSQTVEDIFLEKICDCLTIATEKNEGLNEEVFEKCWSADSTLLKQLEEYLVRETLIPETYEAGYAFGKVFYEKNQVKLILGCDSWFQYMDRMRYDIFDKIDTSKQELKIKSFTHMLQEEKDNPAIYIQRGVSYFILGEKQNAKSDFETASQMPHASPQCLYFLGWIAELNFEFEKAISYYQKAREYSGITYFDTMIGIAERKKRDYFGSR